MEGPRRARPPAGHRPRKRFAQHFLSDAWAVKVVRTIDVQPHDVVLEIGAGAGAITVPLAATGAPILAVEIDRDLSADLASKVPPNVSIITADFLKTDVLPFLTALQPNLPPDTTGAGHTRRFRVVGNLPYNISSPILFRLIELSRAHEVFADATLMVQREVADRLVAKPGTKAYGVLSVFAQIYADIERKLDLPPAAFSPPPKVRSSVVRLTFRRTPVRIVDELVFQQVVKVAFMQRRKMLTNALKHFDATAPAVLALAGIDGKRRPETLTLAEFARLTELFVSVRRPDR
ncbi:MAG TPA: 16S rRNA (adenine(1518)-N(6)/adenine(1519)-N(6))-dimethyltransferase RsmA [Vicinamibacterales bacterium]|nr:16S rRNA (adenine(1518)-N(6)/adenine(1519)-N(6))-dimethyltransferase RsmA [Vicinamibacterales bacterium]